MTIPAGELEEGSVIDAFHLVMEGKESDLLCHRHN